MFTGAKPLKLDLTKDLRSLYPTGNKLLHERATPHAPIISFILPEYQTQELEACSGLHLFLKKILKWLRIFPTIGIKISIINGKNLT